MHVRLVAVATALSAIALPTMVAVAGPSPATAAAGHAATRTIVVRPVTATGHVRPGFRVRAVAETVDCSYGGASPVSLSRNVDFCSPSAAYAVACWKAASRNHVLCLQDPTKHRLSRFRTDKFAPAKRISHRVLSPMLIVLADGTRCAIRDGGAWGVLKHHPHMSGTYSCTHHGVVWARANAPHGGVNESTSAWTVQTAQFGAGHLVTRRITRAYFVGTFSG
jgi:hypothetical protein